MFNDKKILIDDIAIKYNYMIYFLEIYKIFKYITYK